MPLANYVAQNPLHFHRDAIVSMDFDATGHFLVSIDAGHRLEPAQGDSDFSAHLVVWDLRANAKSPFPYEYALEMKFGLSQVLWLDIGIVVAGRDGSLTIITQDEGARTLNVQTFLAHPALIHRMAFSKTNRLLLTAGADEIVVWNTPGAGWKRKKSKQHTCSITSGTLTSPEGFTVTGLDWRDEFQFIVGYMDHHFVIWDVREDKPVREVSIRSQDARVDAVFHDDIAAISYARGGIDIYDVAGNFFKGETNHGRLGSSPCLLVHDGAALIHGTEDGNVILTSTKKITTSSDPDSGAVVLSTKENHNLPICALAATRNKEGFTIASGTRTTQGGLATIDIWHADLPIKKASRFAWSAKVGWTVGGVFLVILVCFFLRRVFK